VAFPELWQEFEGCEDFAPEKFVKKIQRCLVYDDVAATRAYEDARNGGFTPSDKV
jgi:hypothetical protein